MPKSFLTPDQKKTLAKKKWTVRPEGFYITLYAEDYRTDVWEDMCSIADIDAHEASEMTILAYGVK